MPLPAYDPKPLLPTLESSTGVRYFQNASIQRAVDEALAELGPDTPVAVVAHQTYNNDGTVIENKTTLSAAARNKDGKWSIMVAGYKDWTRGDLGAEAKVVWKPF
jgi:hypothetical protein